MKTTIMNFKLNLPKTFVLQQQVNYFQVNDSSLILWILFLIIIPLLILISIQFLKFKNNIALYKMKFKLISIENFKKIIMKSLNHDQIDTLIQLLNEEIKKVNQSNKVKSIILILFISLPFLSIAQATDTSPLKNLLGQSGIIITILLTLIPILFGVIFAIYKINNYLKKSIEYKRWLNSQKQLSELKHLDLQEIKLELEKRKNDLNFKLTNNELKGNEEVNDYRGLINSAETGEAVFFLSPKKNAQKRPKNIDPDLTKLILWYLGVSCFWLLVGTGIGEYVGIKFISPEIDTQPWLSFGKLRPIHTNIVFWGWASLGMIGLGYYVIPIVSNTKIYSVKLGWIALIFTNLMIILGCLCLFMGMNNGGGEFREFIWPVMALFAVALILTIFNFIMTVAQRQTEEIYISNWYIISAFLFTIVVALTAYIPFWQDGVSESIVQGYFMHSGVGMWFTLQILGLMYYFIPQQLNQPLYSYSLSILAFWSQIIFYTIIGTHHFVFAPIPWWLQIIGIVGSVGMIIPVLAATINFLFTFKGNGYKILHSYSLPFFLVAVIFYGIVSLQGTAEAFQFTNLLWHFTDFTVGHAHLGFYGIITFAIWGAIYAIVPRLTGKEPEFSFVGVHFWLAFIGMLLYGIPLSIGATLKGILWMEGKPFIDSVIVMFDYWIWRAVGGSFMFLSHLVFAYNFYTMNRNKLEIEEYSNSNISTFANQ